MANTSTKITKNPNWTRDELILAIDLYFRIDVLRTSEVHPEIIALSKFLNALSIHPVELRNEKFRNPNGVYTKLLNIVHVDRDNPSNGLPQGSRLDKIVWDDFVTRQDELKAIAVAIRSVATISMTTWLDDEDFKEGRILERVHKLRERNPRLVANKKALVLTTKGTLACEVCDFDFSVTYGLVGENFIECHHILPLANISSEISNKLSDLAIVCANCHRMLHRGNPRPTIDELRIIIRNQTRKFGQ